VALADDNDPTIIEQRLAALESKPEQKSLIAGPAASARKALERIKNAHATGDVPFALELGALAKDYVDYASDVVRASELEKELVQVQKELLDVEQKRQRTEILVEETVAHRERSKQELHRLQQETPKAHVATPSTPKAKTQIKEAK
jgi:organic radical activating enzyme